MNARPTGRPIGSVPRRREARSRGAPRGALFLVCVVVLGALASARAASPALHPRVAIVFEHAGSSLADLRVIYAMHQPFGLGIFPDMRYSAQIVREAAAHGLVPVLHLPLEP